MQIIADKTIHHIIKSYPKTSDKLQQLRHYYDLGALPLKEYKEACKQVRDEAKIVSGFMKKVSVK